MAVGKRIVLGIGVTLGSSMVFAQTYFPSIQAPIATSKEFVPWARSYVEACIATAPIAKPTTYYFSQQGSDSLGNGTQESPWQTLAKANSVISSSNGNIGLKFHQGSIWREEIGLRVTKPKVSLSSYRLPTEDVAPKPLFTRFAPPLAPSDWTSTGHVGTYSTLVSGSVAWVKFWNDETTVFRRMTSLDDCYATQGSWFSGGGKLYVHAIDDIELNDGEMRIEYVLRNNQDGITIQDVDRVRVDGLRVEGFGAGTPGDHSYSGYGIRVEQTDAKRVVITGCETFYNGRHSITKVVGPSGSGKGGSLVVARCRMGWLVNDGLCAISYSPQGGQELVSAYNEFLGGQLPNTNNPYPYGGSYAAHYAHTSDDALYQSAFFLCLDNKIDVGPYMMSELSTNSCAPAFNDIKDCRSFVIGEIAKSRVQNAFDLTKPSSNGGNGLMFHQLGSRYTTYVNCVVEPTVLWTQAPGDVCSNTSAAGLWLNSSITFDFTNVSIGKWSNVLSVSSVTPNFSAFQASFYGCRLWFKGKIGAAMGFSGPMVHKYGPHFNKQSGAWQGEMVGCVTGASNIGSGTFNLGWGNTASQLVGNSYFGLSTESGAWGCDADLFRLPGFDSEGMPGNGFERRLAGPIFVNGHVLEYDFLGTARYSQPNVGPYEQNTSKYLQQIGQK